ncbi:diacylglycerol/lipid kinase family protein [Mangrovibacterium lignilyticum]|uniref:diacylglycerol/lipid kinase family protein n=1 Tax=Mangrovibacterium lignilyticum TaxID=2668052 RepID=UPI0013D6D813|nr:diacylglycerol kinase family protein [Mangrovibacterium lignilyticum]
MPNTTSKENTHVLFVINPISGDIDKDDLEGKIKDLKRDFHFNYSVFYTTGEDDESKLAEVIEQRMPDRVLAVGGDGTCNMVAKVLLNQDLPMGIIPMGSANGMARELDIPEDPEEAIRIALTGKIDVLDVLKVNEEHISLHLSDIGINAAVIERFEKEQIRGLWGYGRQYLKAFFQARPIRFTLTIDGRKIRKRAYMVVMANATKYGTGASINPTGKMNDGWFEVILIRPYRLWHLIGMIISFFTREIHHLDYVDVYPCRQLHVRNSRGHVAQVDGEIIGQMEEVGVEILPRCLKVFTPI